MAKNDWDSLEFIKAKAGSPKIKVYKRLKIPGEEMKCINLRIPKTLVDAMDTLVDRGVASTRNAVVLLMLDLSIHLLAENGVGIAQIIVANAQAILDVQSNKQIEVEKLAKDKADALMAKFQANLEKNNLYVDRKTHNLNS
jgi:hypothetical protein